jgi:hypothetical protein
MICKECGEYMEYIDEGEDENGQRYDLYICIECGYEEAVPQPDTQSPPKFDWDPPDGYGKR